MVGKNFVGLDEGHEAVEGVRVNPETPSKSIRAGGPPLLKEVKLRRFRDRRGFEENAGGEDMVDQFSISTPPVKKSVLLQFAEGR
jgi:hypothetical protein